MWTEHKNLHAEWRPIHFGYAVHYRQAMRLPIIKEFQQVY